MAHLTKESPELAAFAEGFIVHFGPDGQHTIQLYNPTTEEIAPHRMAVAKAIADHMEPPYKDVFQNEAVAEAINSALPQVQLLCFRDYDDRTMRAVMVNMNRDQHRDIAAQMMELLGIDAAVEMARTGETDPE